METLQSIKTAVSKNLAKGVATAMHVRNVYLSDRGGPISEILESFLFLGNLYAAKSESTLASRGPRNKLHPSSKDSPFIPQASLISSQFHNLAKM